MKLIRETISREITEVFLHKPVTLNVKGKPVSKSEYLRIATVYKIVEGGSIFQRNIIGYEFETCLDKVCKWNKMDGETYYKIVQMTKGWMPDYRGSFKVSQKIIGITFK
jgi:hypothetical protein